MWVRTLISISAAASVLSPFAAGADPWKDESGKGKSTKYGQPYYGPPAIYVVPVPSQPPQYYGYPQPIPSGHLPPPGECRDWYPGVPAGQQPPPYRC
jgi:hypothetical protein